MTDLQLYFDHLSKNNFSKAFKLIEERRVDINARNDSGETGLMIAASAGKDYYVSKFINHGANILLQDDSGNNALLKATVSNNSETVALILTKADIEQREGLVTASNNSGYNSLTTAARLGLDQCLKEILSTVPEAVSSQDSCSRDALMTAIYHNKIDLLPTLKFYGARADSMPKVEDSSIASADNPVVLAAQKSEDMLKALREFPGFDINTVGVDGVSPLISASITENFLALFNTMAFCIEHGADVNYRDPNGNAALHYILMSGTDGSEVYVKEIMTKKPDLDLEGSLQKSIIELAYEMGSNEVIEALGLPALDEEDIELERFLADQALVYIDALYDEKYEEVMNNNDFDSSESDEGREISGYSSAMTTELDF